MKKTTTKPTRPAAKKRATKAPPNTIQPVRSIARTMRISCAACGDTFVIAIGERAVNHRDRRCMACCHDSRYGPIVPHYKEPEPKPPTRAPDCIISLGLEWPCSRDDVKARWRELAKKHHPDPNGGDSAEFIIAHQNYEAAIALFVDGGAA